MPRLKDRDSERERNKVRDQKNKTGRVQVEDEGREKKDCEKERKDGCWQGGGRECLRKYGVRKSILRPSIFQASPDMKVGGCRADRIQTKLPFAFRLRAHNGNIPLLWKCDFCADTHLVVNWSKPPVFTKSPFAVASAGPLHVKC